MNSKIILLTMLFLVSCSQNSNVNSVTTMDDLDSDVIVQKLEFGNVSITEMPSIIDVDQSIFTYKIQNISGNHGRIKVRHNSNLTYLNSTCGNNNPKTLKANSSCEFKILLDKTMESGNYPITISVDDVSSSLVIASQFSNYYHTSSNSSSYEPNNNATCKTGFHIESRTCKSDIKPATSSTLIANNALSGYYQWNSNSYGAIIITECLPNYILDGGVCIMNTPQENLNIQVSGLGAISYMDVFSNTEYVCGDLPYTYQKHDSGYQTIVDDSKNCSYILPSNGQYVVRSHPLRGHYLDSYLFPDCTIQNNGYSNELCEIVFNNNMMNGVFEFKKDFHRGYAPRFNTTYTSFMIKSDSYNNILIGANPTSSTTYNGFSLTRGSLLKLKKEDGELDVKFMDNVYATLGNTGTPTVTVVEPALNGEVFISGSSWSNGKKLLKINNDGTLNTEFNATVSNSSTAAIRAMNYNKITEKLAILFHSASSSTAISETINGTGYSTSSGNVMKVIIFDKFGAVNHHYDINTSNIVNLTGVPQIHLLDDNSLIMAIRRGASSLQIDGAEIPALIKVNNNGSLNTSFTDVLATAPNSALNCLSFLYTEDKIFVTLQNTANYTTYKGNPINGAYVIDHSGNFIKTFKNLSSLSLTSANGYLKIAPRDANSLYLVPANGTQMQAMTIQYDGQNVGGYFVVDLDGNLIPSTKIYTYPSSTDTKLEIANAGKPQPLASSGSYITTDGAGNLYAINNITNMTYAGDVTSSNPEIAILDPINGILKIDKNSLIVNKNWQAYGSSTEGLIGDAEFNPITGKWVFSINSWSSPGNNQKFQGYLHKGIVQVNTDGSIDKNFLFNHMNQMYDQSTGFVTTGLIEIQSDGKIILGHGSTNVMTIKRHENPALINSTVGTIFTRFLPDGKIDLTYNSNYDSGTGLYTGKIHSTTLRPTLMQILPDDSLIFSVGSNSTSILMNGNAVDNRLVKLDINGNNNVADPFNVNMSSKFVNASLASYANKFKDLIVTKNNKLLLVGGWRDASLNQSGTKCPSNICMLNMDGTIETSFNLNLGLDPVSGIATTTAIIAKVVEVQDNPNDLIQDPTDNGFIFGGEQTTYKGATVGDIFKIDAMGNLISSPNIITTSSGNLTSLLYDNINNLVYVAGGGTLTLNGEASPIFTNPNNTGSLGGVVALNYDDLSLPSFVDRNMIGFGKNGTLYVTANFSMLKKYGQSGKVMVVGANFRSYNQTLYSTDASHNNHLVNYLVFEPASLIRAKK